MVDARRARGDVTKEYKSAGARARAQRSITLFGGLDYATFLHTIGHPGPSRDVRYRLQILFELEMPSLPLGSTDVGGYRQLRRESVSSLRGLVGGEDEHAAVSSIPRGSLFWYQNVFKGSRAATCLWIFYEVFPDCRKNTPPQVFNLKRPLSPPFRSCISTTVHIVRVLCFPRSR